MKYTPKFEKFWKAYPRKTAKVTAFKAWEKNAIEGDAFMPEAAIADVEKRTRLKWWPRDVSKIPHGATWINQMRWEDDGWEDEIKTREDGPPNTGPVIPQPKDDGPQLSSWQMMCNRLMRNYLLKHGVMTGPMLTAVIKSKNETLAELVPAIEEELEVAEDRSSTRGELASTLAETLLRRFDSITSRNLCGAVIKLSRRQV